ncbi:MAG: hypothetical protein HDS97_02430 [Bacteroidales bacterium]|nr:hypothetical protein [Bacteroidales bacterium]
MKEKKATTYDRIELRSPKVRRILGEVPYKLERWGIIIIGVIIISLIVAVININYPYGDGESILKHIFSFLI